jgi:cellulose synthase/poly-beta-1,6-N-acetylglucosamine synthase-like glycosyltransferase
MKKWSTRPWKLDIDENYQPAAAVLVPVHNEEKTIRLILENLSKVKYPVGKIESPSLARAQARKRLDRKTRDGF